MKKTIALTALGVAFAVVAATELKGKVVAVLDGDMLILRVDGKNVRVRLDGVDAPEPDQPYGKSARQSLARLCRGKEATVVERGKDEEGRVLGSVRCGEVDVNAEQVRRGMAWVRLRYLPLGSPLYEFETNARLRGVGLWRAADPVPPWEWRNRAEKAAKR